MTLTALLEGDIMEKVEATTGNATVVDCRRKVNGSTNSGYGKEVVVEYDVPAFEIVSTFDEVLDKFSKDSIIAMAQSRQKATANSGARQKAVSEYSPSGDDLARENMIKSILTLKKNMTREQAESLADAALA